MCKRKLAQGNSDLIENRRPKHKMANILKRDVSQPSFLDWSQVQGSRVVESDEDNNESNDHGCLKASIWNKPEDDPRFVIRIGTAKIRSHSEDTKSKTLEDEQKEKRQFSRYLKEVERRFKKSKIKGYTFPKKTHKRSDNSIIKSRNDIHTLNKIIKVSDLFGLLKSQRSFNNISGMLTSSMDSKNHDQANTSRQYDTKVKNTKRLKKTKTKSFRLREKPNNYSYLKHSLSSGSFNKMKAIEKPCLKQSRSKYGLQFMIERKQINLHSNSREVSKSRIEPVMKQSARKRNDFSINKLNTTQLVNPKNTSRNLNESKHLRRTKSGTIVGILTNRSIKQKDLKPKPSAVNTMLANGKSARILQRVGKKHFSNINRATPNLYKKTFIGSAFPLYTTRMAANTSYKSKSKTAKKQVI